MKLKVLLREGGWTVIVAMVFGSAVLVINHYLPNPFLEDHQRNTFFVGVILFSIVLRMFLDKGDSKN